MQQLPPTVPASTTPPTTTMACMLPWLQAAYGCCGILDEGFAVSWAPRDGVGMPLAVAPAPKRGCFYYKVWHGGTLLPYVYMTIALE
jgi:hypothetical protein